MQRFKPHGTPPFAVLLQPSRRLKPNRTNCSLLPCSCRNTDLKAAVTMDSDFLVQPTVAALILEPLHMRTKTVMTTTATTTRTITPPPVLATPFFSAPLQLQLQLQAQGAKSETGKQKTGNQASKRQHLNQKWDTNHLASREVSD